MLNNNATNPGQWPGNTGTGNNPNGPGGPDSPVLSSPARLNLKLAAATAAVFTAWHLSVAATATGLGLRDWTITLGALAHGHPLAGLARAAGTGGGTDLFGRPDPVRHVTPGPTWLTIGLFAVEVLAVMAMVVVADVKLLGPRRARRKAASGPAGFADEPTVHATLGLPKARASAEHTRPGLTPTERSRAAAEQVGLVLGATPAGSPVVVALEDHVLVLAPTGAGKTRDVMIPAALTAPGALVVTTTRADILDVIAAHRTAGGGRLFVFDPADRLGWPDPVCWDPVTGCEHGERALARAAAFLAATAGGQDTSEGAGFFRNNASIALSRLLHAAALDGRGITDVITWAARLHDGAAEPVAIIRDSTHPLAEHAWAPGLTSVATGADRTVAATRQTIAQIIEPLALRAVIDRLTPGPDAAVFDAAAFVAAGRDTLVLVADANTAGNVAPLCTMLLQEVLDTAKAAAARAGGGRLDPPLRIVGDEIANIAPLPRLPELASDARGFGIQLLLAIQSLPQAERRWGPAGARALADNCPAHLLLGGITDPVTLSRYEQLLGHTEVATTSTSWDPTGDRPGSMSAHTVQRPVMPADALRRIPTGHALLLHRTHPPVRLRLVPWYDRPDGPALTTAAAATRAHRTSGADSADGAGGAPEVDTR